MVTVPILLIALTTVVVAMRATTNWLPDQLVGGVLLAALILSLLPMILLVLDRLIAQGGSFKLKVPGGFGVEFQTAAQSAPIAHRTALVSTNLGAPQGAPIQDTAGGNILEALGEAVSNPVAIVDLKDGRAWWESRLLLLLSGASRLGRPRAVVFVATQNGQSQRFIGWGESAELLRCQLAVSDVSIVQAHHRARALTLEWELSESPGTAITVPWVPCRPAPDPNKSLTEQDLHCPQPTYVPHLTNDLKLVPEALLLYALGSGGHEGHEVGPQPVSVRRLHDLFDPVLHTTSIDESADERAKLTMILGTIDSFLALTDGGRYVNLIPRAVAINAVLRSLALPEDDHSPA